MRCLRNLAPNVAPWVVLVRVERLTAGRTLEAYLGSAFQPGALPGPIDTFAIVVSFFLLARHVCDHQLRSVGEDHGVDAQPR